MAIKHSLVYQAKPNLLLFLLAWLEKKPWFSFHCWDLQQILLIGRLTWSNVTYWGFPRSKKDSVVGNQGWLRLYEMPSGLESLSASISFATSVGTAASMGGQTCWREVNRNICCIKFMTPPSKKKNKKTRSFSFLLLSLWAVQFLQS